LVGAAAADVGQEVAATKFTLHLGLLHRTINIIPRLWPTGIGLPRYGQDYKDSHACGVVNAVFRSETRRTVVLNVVL